MPKTSESPPARFLVWNRKVSAKGRLAADERRSTPIRSLGVYLR